MNENRLNLSLLPNAMVGIVLCVVYTIGSLADILLQSSSSDSGTVSQTWSVILKLAVVIYYFFSIYRYHKLLKEMTGGGYPTSPAKAVGFHFIPFYNLYWAVKWTNDLADFINRRQPGKPVAQGLGGIIIILTFIISFIPIPGTNVVLFIGGAVTPILWFIFFSYINNRFKTIKDPETREIGEETAPGLKINQSDNPASLIDDSPIPGHGGKGWALLILPLLFFLLNILLPFGKTIILSFSKGGGLSSPEPVGLLNYLKLFSDPHFLKTLGNTFLNALNPLKLAVVVCLPLLIAFLINKVSIKKESIPRGLTVISLLGASSIGITIAVSGIFKEIFTGMTSQQAGFNTMLAVVDFFFTLGITLTPGVILFQGILKGKSLTGSFRIAPGVVLLIVTIIAYGLQAFTTNFLLAGGIKNFTSDNLISFAVVTGLQRFNLGGGAAISVIAFLPLIIGGIIVWSILGKGGLNLRPINNGLQEENKTGSPIIPLLVIIPAVTLILIMMIYHFTQIFKFPGANAAIYQGTAFGGTIINAAAALLITTAVQLGTSFMGGYALGKLRFRGRKIITFLICCFLFITPNVLFIQLFLNFRALGMINTIYPIIFGLALQPFGVILFKVYFEGEKWEEIRHYEKTDGGVKKRFNTSRGMMCLFISSLLLIYNINQVLLPYISISNSKNQLSTTAIMTLYKGAEGIQGAASKGWVEGIFPFILLAFVLMIIPQVRFFPKMFIGSNH